MLNLNIVPLETFMSQNLCYYLRYKNYTWYQYIVSLFCFLIWSHIFVFIKERERDRERDLLIFFLKLVLFICYNAKTFEMVLNNWIVYLKVIFYMYRLNSCHCYASFSYTFFDGFVENSVQSYNCSRAISIIPY